MHKIRMKNDTILADPHARQPTVGYYEMHHVPYTNKKGKQAAIVRTQDCAGDGQNHRETCIF